MRFFFFLVMIVLAVPASAADYVKLKVTNESPRKAYVALGYQKDGKEIVEGWWVIDPFDENTFSTVDLQADYRSPLRVRITSASKGAVSWSDYETKKRPCHPNHAFKYEDIGDEVKVKHKKDNGNWHESKIRSRDNRVVLPRSCGYEWSEFHILYPGPKGRLGNLTYEGEGVRAVQSYRFNIPRSL